MQVNFKARILEVGEKREVGKEKKYTVVDVVVEECADKYPATLQIGFWGESVAKAQSLHVGDVAEFTCDVSGRRWPNPTSGKVSYFTSFRAYKCELVGAAVNADPAQSSITPEEDEALPF